MNLASASSRAVPSTSASFRAGLIATLTVAITLALPAMARAGSWHIVPSPNIATVDNELLAVDVRSATDAWAVGYAGSYVASEPLVERWNGKRWRVRPAPNGVSYLAGVEALSRTNVWVIGSGAWNEVAVYRWNGSAWKDMAHPFAYLANSISASSGSNVWTVTGYREVHQWNGTAWVNRTDRSPQPDGTYACVDAYPVDVTALSSSNVWVLGYSERGYSVTADHWNGSTWTCYDGVASGPACSFIPTGISGSSAGNVWLVGSNDDFDNYGCEPRSAVPIASKWNGLSWTTHNPPAWPTDHFLTDVSAASASSVWAVGWRRNAQGIARTLTEHWTGARWVDLGGPNKGSGGSTLSSVSIVPGTQTNVWAVGSYKATSTSPVKTLILHYY